jgi:hypothetical protein
MKTVERMKLDLLQMPWSIAFELAALPLSWWLNATILRVVFDLEYSANLAGGALLTILQVGAFCWIMSARERAKP